MKNNSKSDRQRNIFQKICMAWLYFKEFCESLFYNAYFKTNQDRLVSIFELKFFGESIEKINFYTDRRCFSKHDSLRVFSLSGTCRAKERET